MWSLEAQLAKTWLNARWIQVGIYPLFFGGIESGIEQPKVTNTARTEMPEAARHYLFL